MSRPPPLMSRPPPPVRWVDLVPLASPRASAQDVAVQDVEYVLYSVVLPFGVTRAAVAAVIGLGVSVMSSTASVGASVQLPASASFDGTVASNASLSTAFARASNVSEGSVRLLGYGAPKRRLLRANTVTFNVTLKTIDAIDSLWWRYSRGDGNASIVREFGALGLNAAGAAVTFAGARATITVRGGLRPPNPPPQVSSTVRGLGGVVAPQVVVFATAPALAFGAYALYAARRRGTTRGSHRVKKLTLSYLRL
jgi:hypothetical protein